MSAVSDILLAPDVRPFAVAAAIMVALGGIEVLTMLVGFSISQLVGHDIDRRRRQPRRHRRPVSLDQCRRAAAVDPDHPGARRVLDRRLPAAGHRARRRRRVPVCDRCACRRRRQHPRDPDHQPRHRPHHPARRDLCGQRGRFRRPGRRGFGRPARSGTARPGPSQGCLRQLAYGVGTRQSRFERASGRRQRLAGRPRRQKLHRHFRTRRPHCSPTIIRQDI